MDDNEIGIILMGAAVLQLFWQVIHYSFKIEKVYYIQGCFFSSVLYFSVHYGLLGLSPHAEIWAFAVCNHLLCLAIF